MTGARDESVSACLPQPLITPALDVIVVDDEPEALELMRSIIETSGMRVRAFRSVRRAIEAATHRAPDIVVTELDLDGERGEDLAQMLRCDPTHEHARLVAITRVPEPGWETLRLFDAYVRKPVGPGPIVQLLRHFASTASVQRSTTASALELSRSSGDGADT